MQFAAERNFRGTPVQSFFRAHFGHIRVVIYFRKVREDEVARFPIESFRVAKEFANSVIREMAGAAHHALLDVPRVRADLEHFEIVIGFQDEAAGAAEMVLHKFRQIAKVGDDGDFFHHISLTISEGEADGVGGVMRDGKRGDFDVADAEAVAGMEVLDVREALVRSFRDGQHRGTLGGRSEIDRRAPQPKHLRKTANVIAVLV